MTSSKPVTAAHYFAGMVGLAILRDWYTNGDANEARLAELTAITTQRNTFPNSLELKMEERDLLAGYAEWSTTYDGPNPMVAIEELTVLPILQRNITPGTSVCALDAGCGTGRHAAFLHRLGCDTYGVDQSEPMLNIARTKVPDAHFELGTLEELPFPDAHFDLAVCSLALCHLSDPTEAVAELARVLRPGGVLVISDPHPMGGIVGGQAFYGGFVPGQPLPWVRNHRHQTSTWIAAFRRAGVVVEECHEPPFDAGSIAAAPTSLFYPEATNLAFAGLPCIFVWVLRRPVA
jgi:SAM-dependent methyltransferase